MVLRALLFLLPEIFRKDELTLEERSVGEAVYDQILHKLGGTYPEQVCKSAALCLQSFNLSFQPTKSLEK
jgi:hypothetical protein